MEVDCFLYPGWRPRIRAAGLRRDWMDATPESFAYRCLPLGIANAHGWEIGNAVGFSARWTGGADTNAVEINVDDEEVSPIDSPTSLFGQGTITFHIAGLLRTSPGWNLWVGGPANLGKDGIAPLAGVIETDWSPYSFTMNWRFTRPNHWVRFEADEPICFFFPVERGLLEKVRPRARPIDQAPELKAQFETWSRSRDAFHTQMKEAPPSKPSEKWQKLYYRGLCPMGEIGAQDHQAKLRVHDFLDLPEPGQTSRSRPVNAGAARSDLAAEQQARRQWLRGVQQGLRALSPQSAAVDRFDNIDPEHFLDKYYAANRPVVLCSEMTDWPALARWTPDYLVSKIGAAPIEFQSGRNDDPDFELNKLQHRRTLPFSGFIERINGSGCGNDDYLTAFNSAANRVALSPLHNDLGRIDKLLTHGSAKDEAMLWIGPAGTFTPLHHDLTNNLLAQIVGRKSVILVPPTESDRMMNDTYVFSGVGDLSNPETAVRHPMICSLHRYEVTLHPGELLFVPLGWWHQVRSFDFSVSGTYTNFRWANNWAIGFPGGAKNG